MQLVDATDTELRVPVYRLRKPGDGLQFVLLPMIHIGSKAYYQKVHEMMAGCDLILFEGVNARPATFFALLYRLAAHGGRLRLMTQSEMDVSDLKPRMLHADISGGEFNAGWARIDWRRRLGFYVLASVLSLFLPLFVTRQQLAFHLQLEDLPSRDEVLLQDEFEDFERVIVEERDNVLVARLRKLWQDRKSEELRVAIVFGAFHLRAVLRLLMNKLHYHVAHSDWVTVFEY